VSRRQLSRWLRLAGGATVLGVLVWRFGAGPFVDAREFITWPGLLVSAAFTALATVTSALRWRLVARRLGVPLAPRAALAAYYRSQFLNATLPGGVLGDAERALRHGRAVDDVGAGVRATVWERALGQVAQSLLLVVALVAWSSPLRTLAPVALAVGALLVLVAVTVRRTASADHRLARDLRRLLTPDVAAPVALASLCTTACHAAVFLVAMHAVGVQTSWTTLVPLALLVLTASSLPLSVAGWGPREGVTAWAFSVAGLGAGDGLTVSVVYGVLAAAATLPGAVVMLAHAAGRRSANRRRDAEPGPETGPEPVLEEARRG
jgi:uncharacterized membrane protein YbhN (UPF0104 family)